MTTSSGISRSKVCAKCERSLLIDVFRKSGRGYAKTCRQCEGGGKVKSLAEVVDKVATKAPPPVKLNGHLELVRGYGFRASRENGQIVIEQDADDGAATLVFNLEEFKRLAEWALEGL